MVDEKVTAELIKSLNDEIQELRVELAREHVQRKQVEQERDSFKVEMCRLEADRTYTVG